MAVADQGGEERGGAIGRNEGAPKAAIDASDESQIAKPLDFLLAEHSRQRQFAKILSLIADQVINRRAVAEAIRFVEVDLAQHIMDEEISLFPVLRSFCQPDDEIEAVIAVLADEHREDESSSETVLDVLRRVERGDSTTADDRRALRDFADHLRRHIALENGILLPIARTRMSPDALRIVAQSLEARRNHAHN